MPAPRIASSATLTPAAAVAYLHQRQLIDSRQIVSGQLRVTDASRRNQTLLVDLDGSGYVLKQSAGGQSPIADEAAVLVYLAEDERLAGIVPRVASADARSRVLVLHLERDAPTLYDLIFGMRRVEPAHAALFGDALGRLHASEATGEAFVRAGGAPPPVLAIHRPTGRTWRETSPADRELLKLIQRTEGFGDRLDDLAAGWRPLAPVHNDVRWSNCLLSQVARGQASRLVLIDWELAQLGDPCWDLGSAVAEYLACWLVSIPVAADGSPAQFMHLAGFPLERLQPAIRVLWEAWLSRMPPGDDAARLTAVTRYAAARLVQSAWERTRTAEILVPGIALLLQVAFNMLSRPDDAATSLLGLTASSWGRE